MKTNHLEAVASFTLFLIFVPMANPLFKLISNPDLTEIRAALLANPKLANTGIPLSKSIFSKKGHPLHRICDAVFENKITVDQAIEIAKALLDFGADIDGYMNEGDNNTPLIAAASLHAENLGIFYIERGADIFYASGNDGATALHWAAFCGEDKLVAALIKNGARVDKKDTAFNSTPTGWAVHALQSDDKNNRFNQMTCVNLLLQAGAEKSLLNEDSMHYLIAAAKKDKELKELLKQA